MMVLIFWVTSYLSIIVESHAKAVYSYAYVYVAMYIHLYKLTILAIATYPWHFIL